MSLIFLSGLYPFGQVLPPNLALQRTPAAGRAFSFVQSRWSVAGSAELWR